MNRSLNSWLRLLCDTYFLCSKICGIKSKSKQSYAGNKDCQKVNSEENTSKCKIRPVLGIKLFIQKKVFEMISRVDFFPAFLNLSIVFFKSDEFTLME